MHWLLAIPQVVVAYVLQIIANVLTFIAFFAILFTKTYPESLFNIVAMTRRYQYRGDVLHVHASHPVHLRHGTMIRTPIRRISRSNTRGFRTVGAALRGSSPSRTTSPDPRHGAGIIFISFVVIITGKWNEGMRRFVLGVFRWAWRVTAYVTLMTDEYPPFSLD